MEPAYECTRSERGDAPNDGRLHVVVVVRNRSGHAVQGGIYTARPQTEGCAQPKRRTSDGHRVNQVTEQSVDIIAYDGIKRTAKRQRPAQSVMHDAERQRDDDVRRPTVQTPMQKRDKHRHVRPLIIVHERDLR